MTEAEHLTEKHRNELALERQQKELEQRAMAQRLQEQKIQTMDALIEGQLSERQRIAQDLHDRLGAVLAVLKIHMDEMVTDLISGLKTIQVKSEEKLETVNKLIDEASDSLREISANLRSGTLDRFGLVPAIEELCQRARETGRMTVELHHESVKKSLPAEVEWSAYQIVEEALNNVLKHSEADKVIVQLFRGSERFSVSVEDNGRGFDYAASDNSFDAQQKKSKTGMGLDGMKWRAEKAGAQLSIDSNVGHGTTLMVEYKLSDLPKDPKDENIENNA